MDYKERELDTKPEILLLSKEKGENNTLRSPACIIYPYHWLSSPSPSSRLPSSYLALPAKFHLYYCPRL